MALDYTTSPNGFFIQVGSITNVYNDQKVAANALDPATAAILDTFEAMTEDTPALITDGFAASIRGWQNEYIGRRTTLASLAEKRLVEKDTILDELGETTGQIPAVLNRLIFRMNDDSETVDATVVTLATPVNNVGNVGTGEVLQTKILDGRTSPGSFTGGTYQSHPEYRGIDSEFALTETLQIICTSDSSTGGVAEGGEIFSWNGLKTDVKHGWMNEGSGNIGSITAIHDPINNQLFNPDFENTWTNNIPDGWSIVDGTPGTHILQETDSANVFHGDNSLNFTGDAVQTDIKIKSQLPIANLQGSRGFICTVRVRSSIGALTNGDLTIDLEGTGYSPTASEQIVILAANFTATFTLYHFFIILPQVIPSDLHFAISWSGTPEVASLYIDDIAFSPVSYGAGVGIAIVRGSIPWVVADRITIDNTTDDGGTFQRFFRQSFGVQLPSNNAGAETIDDVLAE